MLTKQEKEFIRTNYKTMTGKDMAQVLNIKAHQVCYYIRTEVDSANVKRRNKKTQFSDKDIMYIKENYAKLSYKDIADKLGYTEKQIRGKINNLGLFKKRKFNDSYFHSIDTPIKAYFLGFIFADGWIIDKSQSSTYELGIELNSVDRYVLERLNNELGSVHNIKHYGTKNRIILGNTAHCKESDVLRIYSKKIVKDLEFQGVVPNKTKSKIHPTVSKKFFYDFLRGYIDGDGCWYTNKNLLDMHITCSLPQPLEYVQSQLKKDGINSSIYKIKEKKYRLMCYNRESILLLITKLYYSDDIFCLHRKHEKVKKYILGLTA